MCVPRWTASTAPRAKSPPAARICRHAQSRRPAAWRRRPRPWRSWQVPCARLPTPPPRWRRRPGAAPRWPGVASEVRALAQRSAGAAKEVRELIVGSGEQIANGARQMKQAGATIDEMVAEVNKVRDLVEQISHATQEQSVGISQVNEAVTQLD